MVETRRVGLTGRLGLKVSWQNTHQPWLFSQHNNFGMTAFAMKLSAAKSVSVRRRVSELDTSLWTFSLLSCDGLKEGTF